MLKKQRQDKIIEIVSSNDISTQEMLKKHLENMGIAVTQATLSRDINELDLKKDSGGLYKYSSPLTRGMECPPILKDAVTAIVYAMNTVVIKCHVGMAQAACATLDKMECTDIVGTLAGDDTIFVLMPNEKYAAEFCSCLNGLVFGGDGKC